VIAQASAATAIAAYYSGEAIPAGYTVVADAGIRNTRPPRRACCRWPRPTSTPTRWSPAVWTSTSRPRFYLPADVKWTSNLDATTIFDFKYTQGRHDL
jgi:iron complex outermembrane receptor protein